MKIYALFLAALLFFFSLSVQKRNQFGDQTETFQKDEKADVLMLDGKVYKATVAAIESDKYQIHFDGYSAGFDVWMTAGQLQRHKVLRQALYAASLFRGVSMAGDAGTSI